MNPATEGALAVAIDDAQRADREMITRCERAINALLCVVEGRLPMHTSINAVVAGGHQLLAEIAGGDR